jgi:hypothetical protein
MKLFRCPNTVVRIQTLNSCLARKAFHVINALIFLIVITFTLSLANAQSLAGGGRPAAVPKGYTITPFGYFDPTCVKRLGQGDVLMPDQSIIRRASGNFDSMPTCNFPRYDKNGRIISAIPATVRNPTIKGYVEASSLTTSTSFGKLVGNWTVPPTPTSNDGQTVFLFTGMVDTYDSFPIGTILQPVLAWNENYLENGVEVINYPKETLHKFCDLGLIV